MPLGFAVEEQASGRLEVSAQFQGDVTAEIDLAEEVVRMWGYNRVEATLPGGAQAGGYSPEYRFAERLRRVLTACGGYEALTFPFISETDFGRLSFSPDDGRRQAIRVMNPMVEELALMRTTLVPSALAIRSEHETGRLGRVPVRDRQVLYGRP